MTFTASSPEAQTYPCWKCKGTGIWAGGYYGTRSCFQCGGSGRKRAADPAKRAAELNRRAAADATVGQRATEWHTANPAMSTWLHAASARGFDFATSMLGAVTRFGHLTPNQTAAVQRCIAKDAERQQRKAEQEALPSEVDVSALAKAMNAAKASGLKYVGIDLGGFSFSLAPDHGKNPGAIYVKAGSSRHAPYLGKVVDGRFTPSRDCDADTQADVIYAASHPHEAAVAYGKRTGICACCRRELTDPASIAAGIGPVCAKRYGWASVADMLAA